ncbi:hypothetical protein R6Z07M_014193 [Ovis aries]
MAFDRYVAICKPLHYSTILTGPLITKIGLAAVTRAVTLMTPLPFLLRRFHYCRGPVIAHCYCEHMAVVRLACGDTRFNNIYGIAVAMFIVVLDLLFVTLSYIFILQAVLQLASQEARYKAFGTCVSHIGAILAFYTPVVMSSVMHRVARQAAPHVHILLANFYLLFPPMVNPIIYGVKTKQIRERVLGLFLRKDVGLPEASGVSEPGAGRPSAAGPADLTVGSPVPGVQEKLGVMNKGVVYTLWAYEAQNSDELSFREGDALTILRRNILTCILSCEKKKKK